MAHHRDCGQLNGNGEEENKIINLSDGKNHHLDGVAGDGLGPGLVGHILGPDLYNNLSILVTLIMAKLWRFM